MIFLYLFKNSDYFIKAFTYLFNYETTVKGNHSSRDYTAIG